MIFKDIFASFEYCSLAGHDYMYISAVPACATLCYLALLSLMNVRGSNIPDCIVSIKREA